MKKIDRRVALKLLATSGLLGGSAYLFQKPFMQIALSVVDKILGPQRSKYLKNNLVESPARNLLQINLGGGPTRWYFDNLLKPNDHDFFVPHPWIGTVLNPQSTQKPLDLSFTYKTKKFGQYNYPLLWDSWVAAPGGRKKKMAELQSNLLMIRGCQMGIAGHPVNIARQVAPVQNSFSITGLVADMSNAPIPSLSVGNNPAARAFKSKKGIADVKIPFDHPNYIDFLLKGFYRTNGISGEELKQKDFALLQAENILSDAYLNGTGEDTLSRKQIKDTYDLVAKSLNKLSDVFESLTNKYEDLFIRTNVNESLSGITDISWSMPRFPVSCAGKKSVLELLGHFHSTDFLISQDFRAIVNGMKIRAMAKQFAIAEFCLTEGLSSSILLGGRTERWHYSDSQIEFDGFLVSDIEEIYDSSLDQTHFSLKENSSSVKAKQYIDMDTHRTSVYFSYIMANNFYLGFSAALLELRTKLLETRMGSKNLFDETVIQVASEFDREPFSNPSGTEHNLQSGVTSFLSGIIQEPIVIGNIYAGQKEGDLMGTRGYGAPLKSLSGRTIRQPNISSTLSSLLRVPKIIEDAESLITVLKDETVVSTSDLPTNIEAPQTHG
jgi:hypothetical protein